MDGASCYGALVDAAERGDLNRVRALVSPDSIWHGIGDGDVDELISRLTRIHQKHARVRVEILALVANGDLVGAHLRWHSEQDGVVRTFDEIELVRIRDGVVVEEWAVDNA